MNAPAPANRSRASARRAGCALTVLLLSCALGLAAGAPARADGDPGSDVLVYQSLFLNGDAGVSVPQQIQLARLLAAAAAHGLPVRAAIIASPSDLGAITGLWRKPRAYAKFLGLELSPAYRGRLLVVMPNGVGFNWTGHSPVPGYRALAGLALRGGSLAATAQGAVRALAAASGIHLASSAPAAHQPGGATAGAPRPAGHRGSGPLPVAVPLGLAGIALALLAARGILARALRKAVGHRRFAMPRIRLPRRRLVLAAAALAISALAVTALALLCGTGGGTGAALAANPYLDPGTPLNRPAPDFSLSDQFGRQVALRSLRGNVVILAFNDSECTTLCPLTTQAMLEAKRMLDPRAARQVQLVGIDANPTATSVEDVLSYSQLHGMLRAWRFLTGPLPVLQRVWKRYSIGVEISQKQVDHTPAIFVIDRRGRLARLYITQQSYAAIPQLGRVLASEAASLLPGHPRVHAHIGYAPIRGITPAATVRLPRAGGGTLSLGPGKARLVLFFTTWAQQITGLGAGLDGLDRYQQQAARMGLPRLTAVDEASVEPPGALSPFLARLPHPLSYPVAIDRSGRLADGYQALGQPWLMAVSPRGKIAWYWSVAALGWPSTPRLVQQVTAALRRVSAPAQGAASRLLAGSPPPLAALHRQASELLGGGLYDRIRALRGYPLILNVWGSYCPPCRAEFSLFAAAALRYGRRVAFLGADDEDSPGDARVFLAAHPLSYPSYSVTTAELSRLAVVDALPTTLFIDARGKVQFVHIGQYESLGALEGDVQAYAGGG